MKFLPHILIAAASLACAAGASAQTAYTKATGEACPSGQRNVELWEVKKDAKAACAALAEWDIARLANGASLSGSGYQCGVKESDTRKLGHALCAKAPELSKAVGTFIWSVNDKSNGETTLAANGTFSNNTTLAGHVHLGDWVTVGGLTGIHQFVQVGAHAMVGFASAVAQDVPPFMLVDGNPLAVRGYNVVGLRRRGFSPERIGVVKQIHKLLYRQGLTLDAARAAIAELAQSVPEAAGDVAMVEQFLADATRGIAR